MRNEAQRFHTRTYSLGDGLASSMVWDVTQDRAGRMWFATRSGLSSYDSATWKEYGAVVGRTHTQPSLVTRGAGDDVWALTHGTPFHLYRFDGRDWEEQPGPSGDRLFIGTRTGLAILSNGHVEEITERLEGVRDTAVPALSAHPVDGSVWLVGRSWLGRLDGGSPVRVGATPRRVPAVSGGHPVEIRGRGRARWDLLRTPGRPQLLSPLRRALSHGCEQRARRDRGDQDRFPTVRNLSRRTGQGWAD